MTSTFTLADEKTKRNPSTGIRIVHNRLLGGWYVVRGPHQTPLNGRFDSKAEAQAWLDRGHQGRTVHYVRTGYGSNPRRKPFSAAYRAESEAAHKHHRSLLAAHARAVKTTLPRRKVAKLAPHNYVELRGAKSGKVLFRVSSKFTSQADLKAIAKVISARHGEPVSAHSVRREPIAKRKGRRY